MAAPQAPAQVLTIAQMVAYAKAADFSGNDAAIAGAVGMAESSGNTHAINYVPCVGIWQINVKAHPQYTISQMYDPAANAKAARAIWQSQGWAAWSTYTSGAYKKYLPAAQKAAGGTTAGIGDIGGPVNPIHIGNAIGGGIKDYKAITKILDDLQNPGMWKRVLLVIIGIVLILIGLIKMSATPKNIKLASKIAEVAAI